MKRFKNRISCFDLLWATLLLGFVAANGSIADESDPQIVAATIARKPWLARVEAIPEGMRPAVLAYLWSNEHLDDMVSVLIRLGDQDRQRNAIDEFKKTPNLRTSERLRNSGSPSVIVHIIDAAFQDDALEMKLHDDVGVWPVSVYATDIVIGILSTTPELPEAVRSWANALPVGGFSKNSLRARRNAVRSWWVQNSEALLRGDYASLQPVEGPIPEARTKLPSTPSPTTAMQTPTRPLPPPPRITRPLDAAVPSPAPPASHSEMQPISNGHSGWWLALAFATAIALGNWFLKR